MKQEATKSLIEALREMKGSKKWITLLATLIAWGVGVFGFKVSPDVFIAPVGAVCAWLFSQGTADRGKEAEKEKRKLKHEDYDGEETV